MILPDGINPRNSIFYIASLLLNEIDYSWKEPLDVMTNLREKYSLRVLLLAFDWLFVANALRIKKEGDVLYVSKKIND